MILTRLLFRSEAHSWVFVIPVSLKNLIQIFRLCLLITYGYRTWGRFQLDKSVNYAAKYPGWHQFCWGRGVGKACPEEEKKFSGGVDFDLILFLKPCQNYHIGVESVLLHDLQHSWQPQLKSLVPKSNKSTFGTSEKNRFLWRNLYRYTLGDVHQFFLMFLRVVAIFLFHY